MLALAGYGGLQVLMMMLVMMCRNQSEGQLPKKGSKGKDANHGGDEKIVIHKNNSS